MYLSKSMRITFCPPFNGETNAASLDEVYIGAVYSASLTNDVNQNGVPDAEEIAATGDVFIRGTVFKFR